MKTKFAALLTVLLLAGAGYCMQAGADTNMGPSSSPSPSPSETPGSTPSPSPTPEPMR